MSGTRRQKSCARASAAIIAAACLAVPGTASADSTWDAEGGDGLWNTAANWSGDAIPTTADFVILDNLQTGTPGDPAVIDLGTGGIAQALYVSDTGVGAAVGQTTDYVYTLNGGPLSLSAGATGVRHYSKNRSFTINCNVISSTAGQPIAFSNNNGGPDTVGATSVLTVNGNLSSTGQMTLENQGRMVFNGDNSGVQRLIYNSSKTGETGAVAVFGHANAMGGSNVQYTVDASDGSIYRVGLTADVTIPGEMRFGRNGDSGVGSGVILRVESGNTDRTLTVLGAVLAGRNPAAGEITTELATAANQNGATSEFRLAANGNGDAGNITLKLVCNAGVDMKYQSRTTTVAGSTVELNAGAGRIIAANLGGVNGGIASTGFGEISGAGRLVKSGAGTVDLGFEISQTGGTEVTAGTLKLVTFTSGAAGTKIGQLPDSGTLSISPTATLDMNGYSDTIGSVAGSGPIINGGNLTIAGDNASPVTYSGNYSGTGSLLKQGAGRQNLGGNNAFTAVTVQGGILGVNSSGALGAGAAPLDVQNNSVVAFLPTGTGTIAAKVGTVSVGSSAKIDLADGKLITTSGVGTATAGVYDGVSGLIQTGRNGGGWGGNGIVTSQTSATTSNFTSIGVATAAQVKGIAATATAVFAGQTVTGSDTLVMYTYGGDANLDGKINVDDYGRIDGNVGQSGIVFGWFNGDFNYDGKINIDDYGIIDGNINQQGAPFATAGGESFAGVAAVPEPASAAALAIATLALGLRRRRRR